jgi:multimeric flavodoxin WrbA
MINSDAVIYASPLYAWDFSAQLKQLLDRHYSLGKNYGSSNYISLLEGKRTALLVTCGGGIADNADLIQEMFDRQNNALKCDVIGKYIVPLCTTPDALGDEARAIAEKMAEDIG